MLVLEMKKLLGAGGMGMGKGQGSCTVGEGSGEGFLDGEMGLVIEGPAWVLIWVSATVSESVWSLPISPDSEG